MLGVTYTVKPVSQDLVTKTINGQLQTFQRFILEFPKMPFEGTQTITFTVTGGSAPALAKFTLLYGPFADFKTIVDHMPVYDDATKDTGARTTEIINGKLSLFEGSLQNINNTSEIRYVPIQTVRVQCISTSTMFRSRFCLKAELLIPMIRTLF